MKKYLWMLVAFALLAATPAYAGTTRQNVLSSSLLDNSPTAANTGAVDVRGAEKIAFFVTVDETEVGASVSVAVTCQVSYDGTNFLDASFYDYAGAATLQTSETISADGRYYFWFNKDLVVPYVKVIVTATNTDADDTALVQVDMVTLQ